MRFFLLTLLLALPLYLTETQSSEAQLTCPSSAIDQITEAPIGNSEDASLNANGRILAFESNVDFNNNNMLFNRSQIYLFNRSNGVLTLITNDTDNSSLAPSINADGNLVAFASDSNINGGNIGNDRQIYVYNVTTGIFTQITAADRDSNQPSISADGMWVAFQSSADFTGQNPDFSTEIFLANVNDGTIIQITADPDPMFNIDSQSPSISGDGNIIAFQSDSNIDGLNPDEIQQIFIYNVATDTFTVVSQASGSTSALQAAVSADGRFVVYRSTENINGGNPEENSEIFLYEIATDENTQITFTTGSNQRPSINGDGSLLAFESDGNFNGNNPNFVREIWLYEVEDARFIQITDVSAGLSEGASISAEGTSVAFHSRSDINGNNPGLNREVYVSDCFGPKNVPTLSEWGLIAMAGILGLVSFFVIRRRLVSA